MEDVPQMFAKVKGTRKRPTGLRGMWGAWVGNATPNGCARYARRQLR